MEFCLSPRNTPTRSGPTTPKSTSTPKAPERPRRSPRLLGRLSWVSGGIFRNFLRIENFSDFWPRAPDSSLRPPTPGGVPPGDPEAKDGDPSTWPPRSRPAEHAGTTRRGWLWLQSEGAVAQGSNEANFRTHGISHQIRKIGPKPPTWRVDCSDPGAANAIPRTLPSSPEPTLELQERWRREGESARQGLSHKSRVSGHLSALLQALSRSASSSANLAAS